MTSARERLKHPVRAAQVDPGFKDVSVDDLVLSGWPNVIDIADSLEAGNLDRTIEGASTLDVTVRDPDRKLLRSNAFHVSDPYDPSKATRPPKNAGQATFTTPVFATIDGSYMVLVKIEKSGSDITLTFEESEVFWLRAHTGKGKPAKANRAKMTRAQFAQYLVRAARGAANPLKFYSPELATKQPIANKKQTASQGAADADRASGFAANATIKVKGKTADKNQIKNLATILAVAESLKASDEVKLAALIAATQESTLSNAATNGVHVGLFQMDNAKGTVAQRRDPAFAANWFVSQAIQYEKANYNEGRAPGDIAEGIERSGKGPTLYEHWLPEAKETLKAYTGGGAGVETVTVDKVYEFKVGPAETYWDCLQRLAAEVNWRCFVVAGTVYFVSEELLFKSRPRMTISEDTPGVDTIDFQLDRSTKGNIEATVICHAAKWIAPPGTVVVVKDCGPADGRWLVHEISRSLFDSIATITLAKPLKKLPEPAPDDKQVSATTGTDNERLNKVYAKAVAIDNKKMPYVWAGGHAKLGVADQGNAFSGPKGFDCSGAVSALLGAIGALSSPQGTGGLINIGEPGPGKYLTIYVSNSGPGGGHTYVEFNMPAPIGKRRWAAENSTGVGFKLAGQAPPAEAYTKRHIPGL